jgi:yecA family protein
MAQITLLPTYAELNEALNQAHAPFQAADAHGVLSGLICVTNDKINQWEKLILGNTKDEVSSELLDRLYETSFHQMSEFSFEFSLLLPDENIDINTRTEALGLWCQGFLTGLAQSKTPVKDNASPEVSDALNDIIEIAQVSFGDIASTEEDETAYYELVEYVRLIVLMIYHELKSTPPLKSSGNDDVLH